MSTNNALVFVADVLRRFVLNATSKSVPSSGGGHCQESLDKIAV